LSFDSSNGYEIEENFAGTGLIQNAIENSRGAGVEELGLDGRIFLVEGVEEALGVFDAGRSIPYEGGFLFCSLDECSGVTVLGGGGAG